MNAGDALPADAWNRSGRLPTPIRVTPLQCDADATTLRAYSRFTEPKSRRVHKWNGSIDMSATLTVSGYVLISLLVPMVGARWLIKHHPAMREDVPSESEAWPASDANRQGDE